MLKHQHIRLGRIIRLATATTTLSAILVIPLSSVPIAASPTDLVGSAPLAVAVNPSTNTVYVANFGDNSVSVIKGKTNTVTATVPVGSS